MRTVTKTVYQFSELSESAKERARNWYRSFAFDDSFWSDCAIEDVKECATILGIQIEDIFWSGFSSQGDGACFVGRYVSNPDCVSAIAERAPDDAELRDIAARLYKAQRLHGAGTVWSEVINNGHRYCHEGTMAISVYDSPESNDTTDNEDLRSEIVDALRDFAKWIYRRLESEYYALNSDESIDESIESNEYEFDEDGDIA